MMIPSVIILSILAIGVVAMAVVTFQAHRDNVRLARTLNNWRPAKPQYWRGDADPEDNQP